MLRTGKPIEVRLAKFHPRLDTDGRKWLKVTLETVIDGNAGGKVSSSMLHRYKFMGEDADIPSIASDDKMESVQLEFTSIGSKEVQKKVPITELTNFTLAREKNTQAGTLKKEKSGRIVLSFVFSEQMMNLSGWVEEHYGNLINVTVEKAQEDLVLEAAAAEDEGAGDDNPDSQAARNERIVEEEKKDAEAAPAVKPKRSHKKKKA